MKRKVTKCRKVSETAVRENTVGGEFRGADSDSSTPGRDVQ